MKLIRTSVTQTHCEMRLADSDGEATEWIDVRVKLSDLEHGSGTPLPDPAGLPLSTIQTAVLRFLQTLAIDEIRRLSQGREGHNS